ncbi:MAG: 50S ribosomal protein L11 methyltransferase [Blastocatellia bacterium]
MYSVSGYGQMIADSIRMNAYVEALRQSVNPGSVVLDIGTGTGICALLACQLGARRVYAIETSDAIQVAREIAAANSYADRIEFIQELSTKIELPERADVIVSDLRGVLPFLGHHFASIADARLRFLAPGGVLIPQQDTMWAAVVSAPELHHPFTAPWEQHNHGFNMQVARKLVLNTWGKGRVTPEQLLTEPQSWARLDYTTLTETNVSADMNWQAAQAGEAHGLLVWFDTVLVPGVGFSNAPGGSATVYSSSFFPFLEPVDLKIGDDVKIQIKADLVGDDYLWSWNTLVKAGDGAGAIKANFKQSTFFGAALSPKQLRKQADNYVPRLNEDGLLDQFILSQMSGEKTHGEIARLTAEQYPHRFQDWRAALTHIAKLANQYSD